MKLSEILRDKSIDVDSEMLDMAADMAEILEAENQRLRGQVEITAVRARHFLTFEHDVGDEHHKSRWTSIAEAHEETLDALKESG